MVEMMSVGMRSWVGGVVAEQFLGDERCCCGVFGGVGGVEEWNIIQTGLEGSHLSSLRNGNGIEIANAMHLLSLADFHRKSRFPSDT